MSRTAKIPPVVFLCALFVFLFCSLFSYFVLDHTPHLNDEIAYNFQAKIFLSGRLYAPSPSPSGSFDFPHIVNNGRWYAQYPPGFPALMFIGHLFQAPWLINPLLAGLSIFLFYFLGTEMYSRKVGIVASILGSLSIWHLVLSSTMMSHTSSMFFMTLFLLFLFKSLRVPTLANGALAGVGLGMMLLIRPLDTALLSIPFLIYYGISCLRSFHARSRNLLGFVLSMGIFAGILFTYNALTNGHPFKMGYMVYLGEGHGLGFGSAVYDVHEHNAFLGFQNIADNLTSYSRLLFGWPLTSFFAVLSLLLIRKQDKTHTRKDLLLASSFMCQVSGLLFYWGAFPFLGPRLFFSTLPLMLLLSARGIFELERSLKTRQPFHKPGWATAGLYSLILVFTVYAFTITLPRWVKAPGSEWFFERIDSHFAGVNPDIHNTIKTVLPEGGLEAGAVLPERSTRPGHIALLQDPLQFYKTYSPAFRSTMVRMFSEQPFWEVDAKFLFEKGKEALGLREYADAVHFLEAALQLERQPFFRNQLLNLLATCYLKSGDTELARTIQVCLQQRKDIHMYNVLPERGF